MSRRKEIDSEILRVRIQEMMDHFGELLKSGELRQKVLYLVEVSDQLDHLGISMLPGMAADAAENRVLEYLKRFQGVVIAGAELGIVSGIQEYARRIRELRKESGWKILSGASIKDQLKDEESEEFSPEQKQLYAGMRVDDYILVSDVQDRDSAHRWHMANSIRKSKGAVRDKILKYFMANIGKEISGEELRYVAKDKTEWARRTRELRTEFGWPIVTRGIGRPDMGVGYYVLESDRKNPDHDRKIPDKVRVEVLTRDHGVCWECEWDHTQSNPSDPRKNLELHHLVPHAQGGENVVPNLVTLCNVCHDDVHGKGREAELLTAFRKKMVGPT